MSSFADALASFKSNQKVRGKRKREVSSSSSSSKTSSCEGPPLTSIYKASLLGLKSHDYITSLYASPPPKRTAHSLTLLFIIIDRLPHSNLWSTYISEITRHHPSLTVNVKIHAKQPSAVKDNFARQYLVPWSFEPQWGSVEITRAMIRLLEEGVDDFTSSDSGSSDTTGHKFVFVSESCIPIMDPAEVLRSLFPSDSGEKSWLTTRSTPNNGYAQQKQWDQMKDIESSCKRKSDQWMALSGREAKACVFAIREFEKVSPKATPLWRLFNRTTASDELFFATLLALLDLEQYIEKRMITLVDWEGYTKNPRTFEARELKDVIKKGSTAGVLNARKFTEVNFDEWKRNVVKS